MSVLVAAAAAALAAGPGLAQSLPTFTTAQADRGEALFAQHCALCHGAELEGGQFGPPLAGSAFEARWGGAPLDELFGYIRSSMPPAEVGQLDDPTLAAMLTHVLRANGAAPGDAELPVQLAALAGMTAPGQAVSGQDALRATMLMHLTPDGDFPDWPARPNPLDDITPVTEAMISNPPPGEWLSWRRGHEGRGFSPLDQIDTDNVGRLQLAWSLELPAGPNTIEPLFHDGVLFVSAYGDKVFALDGRTGDELWRYERQLPQGQAIDTKRVIALYGERVYAATSDAHIVALDMKTGRVVWDHAVGAEGDPARVTGGPLVANGVVMQGVVSKDIHGGNYITGLDAETGELLWRFHTIAQPGDPNDKSWNGIPVEERSGGSVWTSGTYDADLDLAYFGDGATYDTGPLRFPSGAPGTTTDALYTDATMAIRPRTGELVWHFQHMRNDQWDMDWAFERAVVELPINGETRKAVITSGKEGWFDILDAGTGAFLGSFDMGMQNFITGVDPDTGVKSIDPELIPGGLDHRITVCPWGGGGRNWMPTAHDVDAGMLYVVAIDACMDMTPTQPGQRPFLSTDVSVTIAAPKDSDGRYGIIQAINTHTGETLWTHRQRAPPTTGALATAGGLLFNGALDRRFSAFDRATGERLWTAGTPDVPNGTPITYEIDGKQYVAMVVGFGSPSTNTWPNLVPEITIPPVRSSAVFVFALPD